MYISNILHRVGVEQSPAKAVYYYQRSADAGHPRGQGILGYCYGEGFGVEKDESKAVDLYLKAALQGESGKSVIPIPHTIFRSSHFATSTPIVSMYNVAHSYEEGIGIEQNIEEALNWYLKSANMGNCYAQNSLGYMYEEGIGVEKDEDVAVQWYKLSADQGYPWAQCNLGFCLQNGVGVEKDEVAGAYWYQLAAMQDHSRWVWYLSVRGWKK